jgi:NAD(P)-dependent dehydrogenase (short-subunit alcohol dehydrogenase family)
VATRDLASRDQANDSFDDVDRESFDEVLRVNVFAPLFLTQALLGPLRAAGNARDIILSSEAGPFAGGLRGEGLSYPVSNAAALAPQQLGRGVAEGLHNLDQSFELAPYSAPLNERSRPVN